MLIFNNIQKTVLEAPLKKYSYLRYQCAKRIYLGKLHDTSSGCFLHQSEDPARHEDTLTKLMYRITRSNLTPLL